MYFLLDQIWQTDYIWGAISIVALVITHIPVIWIYYNKHTYDVKCLLCETSYLSRLHCFTNNGCTELYSKVLQVAQWG